MSSFAEMFSTGGSGGSGEEKCSGIALAEVTAIKDPKNLGRVKCKYLTADKDVGAVSYTHLTLPTNSRV